MHLSLHDTLSQARQAIEIFIEAYEPRLSRVQVISLPRDDQLRLAFRIEGLLEVEGLKRQVRFAACLDGSGQVKVH
ncbi:Lysozyme [compost metagenome]